VSVSAILTFVPAVMPTAGAVYRGLYVEKVVQLMDSVTGQATGKPLQVVPLGASVVITIQVTSPDDVSRVVVTDLSAGGLEPVDPNVAGDNSGSKAGNQCTGRFWSWWCVPAFSHHGRETFADRVRWTSWGTLPAGTHTISYQAVAATRGVFSFPPAHALLDDQPELMGLSQAGTIVVADDKDRKLPDATDSEAVAAFLKELHVELATTVHPKGCPDGCPNGGVCQVSTGTCVCYEDFAFVDGDCPVNGTDSKDTTSGLFGVGSIGESDLSSTPVGRVLAGCAAVLVVAAAALFRAHKTCGGTVENWEHSCCPYGPLATTHEQELASLHFNARRAGID
jgi:hypothetical protein